MKKPSDQYFSKSLEKGLRILSLFHENRSSLSISQITQLTCINKTSVFRFANTLVQLGFLKKDPRTKLLKVGPNAISFSHCLLRSFDLLQIIKPYIDDAHKKYNVTADLSMWHAETLLILYRLVSKETFGFHLPLLNRDILHCTAAGKATIANLPQNEMLQIVESLPLRKRTHTTLTSKEELLADLKRTRHRGYSINNEELVQGLIAIAAPLMPATGQVVGAITFDFSTAQYSLNMIKRDYAKVVVKLGEDISKNIPLW